MFCFAYSDIHISGTIIKLFRTFQMHFMRQNIVKLLLSVNTSSLRDVRNLMATRKAICNFSELNTHQRDYGFALYSGRLSFDWVLTDLREMNGLEYIKVWLVGGFWCLCYKCCHSRPSDGAVPPGGKNHNGTTPSETVRRKNCTHKRLSYQNSNKAKIQMISDIQCFEMERNKHINLHNNSARTMHQNKDYP